MIGLNRAISDRLVLLRGNRTKAEFARLIGVSAPLYHQWENGQVPTGEKALLIAEKTGTTVDYLLTGKEPPLMEFLPNPVLKIRRRLGLTQQEMGDKLGVAKNYIYLLESGRKPITTSMQKKLRDLLDKHSFQNSWNKEKKEGYAMRDEMINRLTAVYDELRAIDRELFGARADNKLRDPIKTAMGRLDVAVGRMERAAFNTEGAEVDTESTEGLRGKGKETGNEG